MAFLPQAAGPAKGSGLKPKIAAQAVNRVFSAEKSASPMTSTPVVDLDVMCGKHVVTLSHAGTVFTTGVIALMGSADGTNFGTMASHTMTAAEIAAKLAIFEVAGECIHFKVVFTYTGGDATSLTTVHVASVAR